MFNTEGKISYCRFPRKIIDVMKGQLDSLFPVIFKLKFVSIADFGNIAM